MNAGDLILFKAGKSIISKLIAWGTDSIYSHVGVCVSPDIFLLIEAEAGLVRARDIRKIDVECHIYRVKTTYVYSLEKTVSFLVDRLNEKYDYAGVIYLGFLKLLNKLKIPTKKLSSQFQKDNDYFCSELAYAAFRAGGLDIVPGIGEADVTSPGDIANSSVLERIP